MTTLGTVSFSRSPDVATDMPCALIRFDRGVALPVVATSTAAERPLPVANGEPQELPGGPPRNTAETSR